jgi:hypothetical protein
MYSQIEIDNFAYYSDRKSGDAPGASQSGSGDFFLHDAVGEYAIVKDKLSFSAGFGA